MKYALSDLLVKMGAPEVLEKKGVEWHYFCKKRNDIAGFAEIRLEEGEARLIAELTHIREDYEDDEGYIHDIFVESFYLHAERVAGDRYRIIKIGFDGDSYDEPQEAVVELGLSIFHARALDISILMVQQMFNKQDIVDPVMTVPPFMKGSYGQRPDITLPAPKKSEKCVIIQFPVKQKQRRA